MPKKFEKILEICITKIKTESATVEECITAFPDHAQKLQEILPLIASIEGMKQIEPDQNFSTNAGIRLAAKCPEHAVTFGESARHIFRSAKLIPKRRLRMAQILISLLMAISLLVGGPVAVEAAGPGDALFKLDQALEQAHLKNTSSLQEGVILRMEHATERLEEALEKLLKGRIEDALVALDLYNEILDEVEEIVTHENGLNREELRSMVQEELAQQSGILDRVRLSWPEDAQARNAYQKALQRSNMGVDVLLGPPEIAPQGPAGENAVGPSEEVPMGPNEEAPQGPTMDVPPGPAEEAPLGPGDEIPNGCTEETPQGECEETPNGPSTDAPHGESKKKP